MVLVRLDSVAEVRLGRQRSPKDHDGPSMRPYVRAANVGWDGWKLDNVKSMNFTDEEMAVYRLRRGDLLLSEASGSASEVGKPALWSDEIEDCAFQNTLIRVRPRGAEPRYLLHFFKFLASTGKFARRSRGVGINHLGSEALASWLVPLPAIEEQRRIAELLDAADALRAKRSKALVKLDVLIQAIFVDMFGDPASNSAGWPRSSFEALCPTHLGKMLDQKQQTGGHLRPYLRNTNVRWFGFDLDDVAEMDFNERDRAKYRLEVGDVLICEGGVPGRAAVWQGELAECYFQKALHRGRPVPGVATGEFIVHLLACLAERGGLVDHISTATISHLTGERLKSMSVISPPFEHQIEFARRIDTLRRSLRVAEASGRQLDILVASLQDRAFRGEL